MIIKVIEIRDRATYIPAVAMKMDPRGGYDLHLVTVGAEKFAVSTEARRALYASVGFWDGRGVILMQLSTQAAHSNPWDWKDSRTMHATHIWLEKNFDDVIDGQVVDVEVILGEKATPSIPQRLETIE